MLRGEVSMRSLLAATLGMLYVAASARAAEETWTGVISDDLCGPKHEAPSEGGPELTAAECTLACVRGGSKFAFVVDDDVYGIVDQADPVLATYAGQKVRLTGELSGDAITVKKIEAAEP
jgi:hypothetical protein